MFRSVAFSFNSLTHYWSVQFDAYGFTSNVLRSAGSGAGKFHYKRKAWEKVNSF